MKIKSILSLALFLGIAQLQATTWTASGISGNSILTFPVKLASSANENTVTTWTSPSGADVRTFAASYRTLFGWGSGTALSATGGQAYAANCAIDSSGNQMAIWSRAPNSTSNVVVQASYMPVLTRVWSAATDISSTSQISMTPSVGFNNAGDGTAVWDNQSTNQIQASVFTALTTTWSAPVTVASTTGVRGLQLSVGQGIKRIAMWQDYDPVGDVYNLKSSIYNGSTWLTPTTFTPTTSNVNRNCLQIDNAGNALATWYDTTTTTLRYATCAAGSTTWSAVGTIGSPHLIFGADLAVNFNNGNATLVCITFDGIFEYAEAMNYTLSTNTWTAPVAISSLATGFSQSPSVAIDRSNNSVAVWTRFDGSNFYTETSTFSGSSWSAPQVLSSASTSSTLPVIVANKSALLPAVHAVWRETGPGQNRIVVSVGTP